MGLKLNVVFPVAGVFVVAAKKNMVPYNFHTRCFLEKSCLDEHPYHFWELVPTNVSNKEFGLD